MHYFETDSVRPAADGRSVIIIDQTLLPREIKTLSLSEPKELFEAITSLRVRGAPAIGIFAGYALAIRARLLSESVSPEDFFPTLRQEAEYLCSSRPTAVNLFHAAERVMKAAEGKAPEAAAEAAMAEATLIHRQDIDICRRISEHGLSLIRDGAAVLTHCNAGALATSRYGTGLGPLLLGAERGMKLSAYVDETRPLLQGARLTAWELQRAGIDVTLICDNMAGLMMQQGRIDACFVGCDRVARNGDTANKIGTLSVAVLAKHFGVPFYIFCPSTTIDPLCPTGADIVIEQRRPEEITNLYFDRQVAPEGIGCENPAFDVTDHSLITAIITENGIYRPPFSLAKENSYDERY
ncbi:MAG: S-methyl-5-thioribose-1-phosphate isomerase [Ruminococcus sp.]|nr:S-methyl-5-thioribose-1-phosphate isomerase [Ruminococcus sp.]